MISTNRGAFKLLTGTISNKVDTIVLIFILASISASNVFILR